MAHHTSDDSGTFSLEDPTPLPFEPGPRRERTTVPVKPVERKREQVERHAQLIVLQGRSVGQVLSLNVDHCYVGRDESATVVIDDAGISRLHAAIRRDEAGGFSIEDLGSRNGTQVNGRYIAGVQKLERGDKIALGLGTVLRFSFDDELETDYAQRMYDAALRDGLTGAHNRRYFDERIAEELAYAHRQGCSLSLLMLDIDRFKRINDTHGHLAGDAILRQLTAYVPEHLRSEDTFARYGGEEFAVIARDIGTEGAKALAERIRAAIADTDMTLETVVPAPTPPTREAPVLAADAGESESDGDEPATLRITVSIGVCTFRADAEDSARETIDFATPQRLVAEADGALIQAKRTGRNRVVAVDDLVGPIGEWA